MSPIERIQKIRLSSNPANVKKHKRHHKVFKNEGIALSCFQKPKQDIIKPRIASNVEIP